MPRITTYSIPIELAKKASKPITNEISTLLHIPRDHINFQVNQDIFIQDGEESRGDPFVEVCLFNRGVEKEDEIAQIITRHFHELKCSNLEIHLTHFERRRYYENGKHF